MIGPPTPLIVGSMLSGATVNVEVTLPVSQISVAVNVTVTDPPSHALGACAVPTLSAGLHPPLTLAPDAHATKAASIAA